LSFLHRHGIVHATLEPSKILFDSDYNVKLFNYGLGHLTNYGQYVAFPIFNPRFTAPEVITEGPVSHKGSKKQKELKEGGDEDK
jgi:serine/threonine protein kinase